MSPAVAGEVLRSAAELRGRKVQVTQTLPTALTAVLLRDTDLLDAVDPRPETIGIELGSRVAVQRAIPEQVRTRIRDRDVDAP